MSSTGSGGACEIDKAWTGRLAATGNLDHKLAVRTMYIYDSDSE